MDRERVLGAAIGALVFVFAVAQIIPNEANAQTTTPIPTLEACMRSVLACLSGCKNESACLVACKASLDRCVNTVPDQPPLRGGMPK
jgi:hypothetical protein